MKILALGGHPDDIWLQAGGTLLKRMNKNKDEVRELVFCMTAADPEREIVAHKLDIHTSCLGIPEQKLHLYLLEAITRLDGVIAEYKPDVILCHDSSDHHQDHQSVYQITQAALRHSRVALVTYPTWNKRIPFDFNISVDISDVLEDKQTVLSWFGSQQARWYFKADDNTERFNLKYLQL